MIAASRPKAAPMKYQGQTHCARSPCRDTMVPPARASRGGCPADAERCPDPSTGLQEVVLHGVRRRLGA